LGENKVAKEGNARLTSAFVRSFNSGKKKQKTGTHAKRSCKKNQEGRRVFSEAFLLAGLSLHYRRRLGKERPWLDENEKKKQEDRSKALG